MNPSNAAKTALAPGTVSLLPKPLKGPMTRFATIVATLAALTVLGAGCGSSDSSSSTPKAATPASTSAPAKPAAPDAAAPSSPGTDRAKAVYEECAQKGSDPASLMVCLASHGLKTSDLSACVTGANNAQDINACIEKGLKQ